MARPGRKRKNGKRTKSGQLSRAGCYDKGTERAQLMQAIYGTNGSDAIGRAYEAGLLGRGQDAKAMLDMGRRIFNAYWAAYATGRYQCPLGERMGGSVVSIDHERARRREEWLNAVLAFVKGEGDQERRAFYQLVIDVNPDSGPDWLERLLESHRQGTLADIADSARMKRAVDMLEMLSA